MKNWHLSEFKYFVLIIVSPIVLLALIGCATTQEPLKAETAQDRKRKKSPSLMDDLYAVQRSAGVGWPDQP